MTSVPKGLHRRFVQRGRYLQGHAPFRRAMADAVLEWNQKHPEFSIGKRGVPPDDPLRHWSSDFPWPRRLSAMIDARNARMLRGQDATDLDEASWEATLDWRNLITRMCETWWPPDLYPNWVGSGIHPAQQFVGAALLWDPARFHHQAADDWIRRFGLGLHGIRDHAPGVWMCDQETFWRAVWGGLNQRLEAALEQHSALTAEQIGELQTAAFEAAIEQRLAAAEERRTLWVAPILPGMTSGDWRALEQHVMNHMSDHLPEEARRLRAAGMSKAAIAGELGVDRRSVDRYLGNN